MHMHMHIDRTAVGGSFIAFNSRRGGRASRPPCRSAAEARIAGQLDLSCLAESSSRLVGQPDGVAQGDAEIDRAGYRLAITEEGVAQPALALKPEDAAQAALGAE